MIDFAHKSGSRSNTRIEIDGARWLEDVTPVASPAGEFLSLVFADFDTVDLDDKKIDYAMKSMACNRNDTTLSQSIDLGPQIYINRLRQITSQFSYRKLLKNGLKDSLKSI